MKTVILCALGIVLLVACVACRSQAFASGDAPSVIRAQKIQLVDSNGITRISMAVDPQSGGAAVSVLDANGTTTRVVVGIRPDGVGAVELRDSQGNKRAEMNVAPSGDARLSLIDQALKGGAVLASSSDKTGLVFNDDQPKVRVAIGLAPSAQPALTIYDEKGNVSWNAPLPEKK